MRLVILLKCLLLLSLLSGAVYPAYALDFNAFWLYRNSGGEGRDTREEIQERYSLGVGPQLTYQPTHALSATAAVGYTRTQQDSGRGMVTETQITPTAALSLRNDIFMAQLAGSVSRFSADDRADDILRSWDATLASRWAIPFWPNLRFNYGKRDNAQNSGELFSFSDNAQTTSSLSVDWDLLLAHLDYRFSTSQVEDRESGSLSESETHFARIETDGRLLKNRISYNLSQQVQQTTTNFTIGEVDANGFFALELEGERRGKVDTVVDPAPNEIGFSDPAIVIGLTPLEVGPGERLHLSFGDRFGFPQQIDVLRLRFEQFGEEVANLQWQLFLRDFSGDGWTLASENIPGQFSPLTGTVEIPVNRIANEILLVAVNTIGTPLTLLELRTFSLLEGSGASTSRNYLTNAGVRFNLTKTLSASTNMMLEQLESESADSSSETSRRTLNGQLSWRPRPWVIPSLGYSENREKSRDALEQFNRSYALTVATIPLATMNMNFGVTRTERFNGEQKTDESLKYNVTTTASIYPDLKAALFLSWQENERLVSAAEDVEEEFDLNTIFSGRLNLNARLQRNLVADLTTNYRALEQEDGASKNADATFNLQYRPSNLVALRGFYTAFLLDSSQTNRLGAGLTLALLRTDKARLALDYNYTRADETIHSLGLNGSWDISHNLSLLTRSNYTMSETNFYSFQASLNFKL